MKRAVIYARYSCDNQTEQSIEGQIHVCEEYAEKNDMVILGKYIDRAMTGTNDNRPDFQRMIKESAKKNWDYIIVYKLDRFSRNKYETAKHKLTLKSYGIKVISAMENIPDTPEGIILESVIEGMNQYYSEELSQKVKRGMRETRAKGNFTGGYLVYGYKIENHKVVIDKEKAETIKYIFAQYACGVYVKDIINTLTKKGILNHNKPFARNTIYKMLRNEKYAGIYRYKDEVFLNIYPKIVPQETYDIVRKKIEKNHYGKRSTMTVYLLKSLVYCGYCGTSITGASGTSKLGKVSHYYLCQGKRKGIECNKKAIRQEVLDNLVLQAVIEELSKPEYIDTIVSRLYKLQYESDDKNTLLGSLEREKRNSETALDNIMKGVEMGIMNATTQKRMVELENKINELEREILIEKSKTVTKLTEEQIRKYYTQVLKKEDRLLIGTLVNKVLLFDDKIEIYFNNPLPQENDCEYHICVKSKKTIKDNNYEITIHA